jgi:arabinose-5-phosphate isomerase
MSDARRQARQVFEAEAAAIKALGGHLDENFDAAVEALLHCRGRVIVSGMGKSGLIGRKIAATLNSTGIASFFLHPAEAMHGDLGLMRSDDVLLLISKSGRLQDLATVVATARRLDVSILLLCGTPGAELCERADIVLDCSVPAEACPNNLVPTSSTTAALVMGDALAVALLTARRFTAEDFAALHPGGFLGRRLLRKVSELHHTGEALPVVRPDATVKEMILQMTGKRLGCVVLIEDEGRICRIFTDGDLRRLADRYKDFYNLTAGEVMIANPKTVSRDAILDTALARMEQYAITQLITVDKEGRAVGLLHLHDILKSKLV